MIIVFPFPFGFLGSDETLEAMRLDVLRRNAAISDYVVFSFALTRVLCDSCRFDTCPTDRYWIVIFALDTVMLCCPRKPRDSHGSLELHPFRWLGV